jgi:flagellar export protein FliJ
MSWRRSLVKLAGFQVEELRKRLAEIMDRKADAEMRLAVLHAEAQAESLRAAADAEAGWYRMGYLEGWRVRRDALAAEIAEIAAEEAGARDALADAFAEQKKYEQVEESHLEQLRLAAQKQENAAYDEVASRRAAAAGR